MLFGLVSERENARSSCRIFKLKLVLCVQEVLLISVEHSDVAACSEPGKDNVPHARWILLTLLLLCMFRIYITHRIITVLSQQSEKLFVVIKKENIASGGILLQTEIIRICKRLVLSVWNSVSQNLVQLWYVHIYIGVYLWRRKLLYFR